MNEKSNPMPMMYKTIPAVAELNKVPGFDPLKFLRHKVSRKTNEEMLQLELPYQKLWFRLRHPQGRMKLTTLRITEQLAIMEARVYLDRSDAEPISSYISQHSAEEGTDYVQAAQDEALSAALSDAGFGLQFADVAVDSTGKVFGSSIPLSGAASIQQPMPDAAQRPVEASGAALRQSGGEVHARLERAPQSVVERRNAPARPTSIQKPAAKPVQNEQPPVSPVQPTVQQMAAEEKENMDTLPVGKVEENAPNTGSPVSGTQTDLAGYERRGELKTVQQAERASGQEIHQTLSLLLAMLPLQPAHRNHLHSPKRGLSDEQIDRIGFKSTPPPFLCRSITERLMKQGCKVEGVPGFYLDDSGRWTMNFYRKNAGILIPAVGYDGMIHGLQILLDIPLKQKDDPPDKAGAKYIWFSSSSQNMGVTSGSPVHFIGDPSARVVYVIEGLLKADISHCLTNRTFVAIAGANNTSQLDTLFALLAQNGTEEIIEAHDMDKYSNQMTSNVLLWMYQQDIKPRDVQFIADRMSMVQVYNYVRRQMPSFRRNSHEVLRTWEDYLSMAKKLHMDVYDEIVYRTRKLRRRHDDLVLKCQEKDIELQAEEMEEKFPHVNAICQEIKTKYEYADADYMVVVPSGILDIITEGRALHHCVGSSDRYWDRIERRESFVMFLRKTDDPFHAYYTLEVEPDGTVRQKRTEYDRQKKDIEQATEFLQKWQRVVTARLTESDKALAAESRVLREKEFIQLKKDRVIIHTGHLAGKLLVDVLMADLMENTDSIQSPALAAAA